MIEEELSFVSMCLLKLDFVGSDGLFDLSKSFGQRQLELGPFNALLDNGGGALGSGHVVDTVGGVVGLVEGFNDVLHLVGVDEVERTIAVERSLIDFEKG